MTLQQTFQVRVARKSFETRDIACFELVSPDGMPLPPFDAGAHLEVHLPGGLIRQYSLCNDPAETHRYQIAVLKDQASRGGSLAMHAQVHEGDTLSISVPRNHFPLASDAPSSLLLAGGIGITPILCMSMRLSSLGAPFRLHYCARARDGAAFVARMAASAFADQVSYHFDDGEPKQRLDLAAVLRVPQAGTHLYVCGPRGFIDAVLSAALAAGWPEAQLHREFFGAPAPAAQSLGAFEVELARTGRVVTVAADQTVVAALAGHGVVVPVSCEQGVCGTCLTRVLKGCPDHLDSYLTLDEQAANDQFLPCCSRSKSPRLVLDL